MLQSRNPTLPSPLRSYFSEEYRPPNRHESKPKVSAKKPAVAKLTPTGVSSYRVRAPIKTREDLVQINSELELAEKKNKKAEQALASWEASLKHERNSQYKYLKERVRLQKQLIKQSDCYTQLLREQAELQRQKDVQAAQQARKDMVSALRAHKETLRAHGEKVTKKLQIKPDSTKEDIFVDESVMQNKESPLSPARPRILNILGMTSDSEICVEDMWRKVRAHSARKMRPVENHLQQLKRSSSPFIRDFLRKIELEGYQYDSNWNASRQNRPVSANAKKMQMKLNLMRSAAQQNEHHAMLILCRNDPRHLGKESSTFDLTMYGFSPNDLAEPQFLSREHYRTHLTGTSIHSKDKKKPPLFLTESGDILKSTSGSVDDKASLVYRAKCEPQNKTFLTQEFSTTETSSSQASLWEPLTLGTLQEHKKVKAVPGHGPFQHGEPKLWRPPSPA